MDVTGIGYETVHWSLLAIGRGQLRALVNTVMNFRFL
jgi:hypothetical protein